MKIRIFLLTITIILLVFNHFYFNKDCCMCGDTSNTCCPCPNPEYKDAIIDWCPDKVSSAGSYKWCCEDYKKEFNKTFQCFK